MCGINVIVGRGDSITRDSLLSMQSCLVHRGPDHGHVFQDQWGSSMLMIGSNRLQVVDENPLSNQPFHSSDGRYCLVYNGEIYNYHDLKNQLLAKQYAFSTASDTEVLLYWLVEYGEAGIKELNGMFAFVFVDLQEQKVLFGRDRHGIKPLFYHEGKDILIISSEIQGIVASGLVKKKLNTAVIPHYLSYKYAPRPATFYKDILELEPGMCSIYLNTTPVSKSDFGIKSISDGNDLKTVLIDTLTRQFEGVEIPGLMLSGGVDSTLLLALLNKELGFSGLHTYTMAYSMGGKPLANDDTNFARKAAIQFMANHQEVSVDSDVLLRMPEFMSVMDQPIADSGAFATWLVAERAGKDSKVLLSGAGADEVFAGYNRHRAYHFYLKNHKKWWFNFLKQGRQLPQQGLGLNHLHKLVSAIDDDPSITYRKMLTFDVFKNPTDVAPIWPRDRTLVYNLEQALLHDKTQYLVSDVLAITDRSSMRASVEVRVPYLDDVVVNYASQFSGTELLRHGRKWMLNNLLEDFGGSKFIKRKKTGFGLPTNYWFNDKSTDWLWSFMEKDAYLFDFVHKPLISRLLADHKRGARNNGLELWAVLILQQWLEKEFG